MKDIGNKYLSLYETYLCNEWIKLSNNNFLYKFEHKTILARPTETSLDEIRKHYLTNDNNSVNQFIDLLNTEIKPILENLIKKYPINQNAIYEVTNDLLSTFQFIYQKNYWIERDIATNQSNSTITIKALNTSLKKLGFKFIKQFLNDKLDNYEWDFNLDDSKIFIQVTQTWSPLFKKQSNILEIEFDNQIHKLYYFQLSPYHNVYVVRDNGIFDKKFIKHDFEFIAMIFNMLTYQNPHNLHFFMPAKITSGKVSGSLLASINMWKNRDNS